MKNENYDILCQMVKSRYAQIVTKKGGGCTSNTIGGYCGSSSGSIEQVNLSPEKRQVFKAAYRILRPGGRLFVSHVVATAEMPESMRQQAALKTGCIDGAEHIDRIQFLLEEVGFQNVNIELKAHSKELVSGWFPGSGAENYVASSYIRAVKPY